MTYIVDLVETQCRKGFIERKRNSGEEWAKAHKCENVKGNSSPIERKQGKTKRAETREGKKEQTNHIVRRKRKEDRPRPAQYWHARSLGDSIYLSTIHTHFDCTPSIGQGETPIICIPHNKAFIWRLHLYPTVSMDYVRCFEGRC